MSKKKSLATDSVRAQRPEIVIVPPQAERRLLLKRKVLSRKEPGFNQRLVVVD